MIYRVVSATDVIEMAKLLTERQRIETKVHPFLNNECLNSDYIQERLGQLLINTNVIGLGCFQNNALIGYILGEVKIDNRNGRYCSIPYEGVALKAGQSPEILRLIYAKASPMWIEQGCFEHSIMLPLTDPVYFDAFTRLSFAIEQVYAVMNIENYKPFIANNDIKIRVATPHDEEAMGKMSTLIMKYQNAAPVYTPAFPEVILRIRENFKGLLKEDDVIVMIAEKDQQVVGFHDYELLTPSLMTPHDGIELSVAGTLEEHRGLGIGKVMVNEGCRYLKEKGFKTIMTDWRITNLAASTFWPKCGFKPIAYRLARTIDKNYAWANSTNGTIQQLLNRD